MMIDIEHKNIEKTSAGSSESKINTYENTLKGKEIGKTQTEDDRKQADSLIVEIQENKESKENKKGEIRDQQTGIGRDKQGEEFAQNNPEKKDRIPAGANVPKSLNESQKGNLFGQTFQGISKRILGKNNI